MSRPSSWPGIAAGLVLSLLCSCSPSAPSARDKANPDAGIKPSMTQAEAEQVVSQRFDVKRYVINDFIPKPGAPPPRPLSPRRTLKIGLYWVLDDELTPWYVGIEKGFFSDQGLDIQFTEGGPSRDMLSSLLANRVDVYVGSPESPLFVINSRTGADLKMICALLKETPSGWIGIDQSIPRNQRSTRHIGADDLRGRRIAVTPGSEFFVDIASSELGIPRNDLHIMKAGATPDVLMSGAVDYYQGFSETQPRILERNGYLNWTFFPFSDLGYQGYFDISTVTAETYQREPQMLAEYVYALSRSVEYVIAHPEEAAEIATRYTPEYPVTKAEALWRIKRDIKIYTGDGSEPILMMKDSVVQKQLAILYRYHQIELPTAAPDAAPK